MTTKGPVESALAKRRFLIGAGSTAVGLAVARAAHGDAPPGPGAWDLIVIGAGTAGLPAAIFAARRGARVLLLEASAQLGGTLHLSTGQMSAAGTKLQKSKGIVDTAKDHYDDVIRISRGTANPELVRLSVFNQGSTLDWLMDNGFEVMPDQPILGFGHEPYLNRRYQWGPEGGVSILKVLEREIAPEISSGRIAFLSRHEAKELVLGNGGRVTGVITKDDSGKQHRHIGRFVLLSCGGYSYNPTLFREINGAPQHVAIAYPYSRGQGLAMGRAVGGYVRGADKFIVNFGIVCASDEDFAPPLASPITYPERRQPWEIIVNVHGRRFVREDTTSIDDRDKSILKQPELRSWIVFDDVICREAPMLFDGWSREQFNDSFSSQPLFYRADSLAALAAKTGVDAAGLANTVAEYNAGQKAGRDALGRVHMPRPITVPPFYAIRQVGFTASSVAGLAVDNELRVIRKDGSVIDGLYAAGEMIGTSQLMGNAIVGGMIVTPALTFGRLLGERMIPFNA